MRGDFLMYKIKLQNVSRKYIAGKNKEFYAVRNVSLIFDDTGITAISGKSGSGKSTIINMIGGIDSPTEGQIYIDGADITRISKSKWCKFYKNKIAILFQSYNLLSNETVLFNVTVSLMINGMKKALAENRAKMLLDYVGLKEDLFKKKASLLSGGEQQRVALARTLANEPDIILCDEPTGALDSKNSFKVMDILKEYSKNHLVILVSHNPQLVNKYSDRIITIADGRIKSDKNIKKNQDVKRVYKKKPSKSSNWIDTLSFSNYKKRFKRNMFSIFAISVSLISAFLTTGFINGKDDAINKASIKQFDFGSGTICEEEEISHGALLSLTRTIRPDFEKLINNKKIRQNFNIVPNFDAILPVVPTIAYDGMTIDGVYYYPVYSFIDSSIDKNLLIKGKMPVSDNLIDVVVNDSCYQLLCSSLNKDALNEYLDVSYYIEHSYVDIDETIVNDHFSFNKKIRIIGVIKELNYLQNPKIYYSYLALEEYLSSYILPNLSTYFNKDITWYSRVFDSENFDSISSYSYRLFLKDHKNSRLLFNELDFGDKLSYTSPSLLIRTSLLGFMQVAEYGLLMFLIITIIGSVLIIGIMSFASYSEDHKTSAILSCLGASESEICSIYLNESIFNGFVSIVVSFLAAYGLSILINRLISKFIDLQNLILIPFASFLGIPFLFPLLSLIIGLLVCILVTSTPIMFSKRVSLKEELQSL